MSIYGIHGLIGKVIADEAFNNLFFTHPNKAIAESGFDLEDQEIEALKKLKKENLDIINTGQSDELGFYVECGIK